MKIITITNNKGGVGKTTTVHNLGYYFAEKGLKTLLIDLDHQANLTMSFSEELLEVENNIYNALKEKDLNSNIHNVGENLYIVPSTLILERLNMEISSLSSRELLLKKSIKKLEQSFDVILIDTPPSLNTLTLNALSCSDSVYIPIKPGKYELSGASFLFETIDEIKEDLNDKLEIGGVFLTLVKSNANLSKEISGILAEYLSDKVMKTQIRDNISLGEAPASYKSIFDHKPSSNGAKDYKALAEEILQNEELL